MLTVHVTWDTGLRNVWGTRSRDTSIQKRHVYVVAVVDVVVVAAVVAVVVVVVVVVALVVVASACLDVATAACC